jgi:hypothetical protein
MTVKNNGRPSLVMMRILGVQPKRRVQVTTKIEKELRDIMVRENLVIADIVNLGIEHILQEKRLL